MPPPRVGLHCRHSRGLTSPSPQLSTYADHTGNIMTGCKQRRFWAEIVTGSHRLHGPARVCHWRRLSRRQPAAARYAHGLRMHYIRRMQRIGRLVGTTWPAGPPGGSVTCEHLDALYHPEMHGSDGSFAHIAYAYEASAVLVHGCVLFASCTSLQ